MVHRRTTPHCKRYPYKVDDAAVRVLWRTRNYRISGSEAIGATGQSLVHTPVMGQLTKAITAAVKAGDETPYAIAKGAGVTRSQLSRLLSGERGLNTDTIERLADYLGLALTAKAGKARKDR